MWYIFVPIHQGMHFTCAITSMEQTKIEYFDSLCFDNVTRQSCRHKIKMQEDKLEGLRDYLQIKHTKEKYKDLPKD